MSWVRYFLRIILFSLYLIVATVALLELTFRILPTANAFYLQSPITPDDIIRFEPNKETTYSLGWNFYQKSKKHTNNYGFVSDHDYIEQGQPDIAVIGDSYVEAMQVDDSEAIAKQIEVLLPGENIYSLAVSGAPLSQYVKFMEYAKIEFNPKEYVIVIVGNDFDESLCRQRKKPGTWCYQDDMTLRFIPFEGYSFARKLARKSAFVRYAVFNLKVNWRHIAAKIGIADDGLKPKQQFAGNTERKKDQEIEFLSYEVVDSFLSAITQTSDPKTITLVLDADRQDVYQGTSSESYFDSMKEYLKEEGDKLGLTVVDLDSVFRQDYAQHQKRFEFPTDGHWNERGHRLAAEAFLSSR